MKKHLSRLCIVFSFVAGISCSRNSAGPAPQPNLPVKKINLYYPDSSGKTRGDFELIISTSAGDVLLDTVAVVNKPVQADLHTSATLLDVTVIAYDVRDTVWAVHTFKDVDPTTWVTVAQNDFWLEPVAQNSQRASVVYTHAPDVNTTFWLFGDDMTLPPYSGSYLPANPAFSGVPTLSVSYVHHGNNPVYLCFPSLRLYKYFQPVSGHDIIDLSQMDTSIAADYYQPGYVFTAIELTGVPDTTDLSKNILAYIPIFTYATDSTSFRNFSYPGKYFEKYELRLYAFRNKDYVSFYTWGPTVPASFVYPDASYYSIGSDQGSDFKVNFPSTRPFYYGTEWTGSNIQYDCYAPPDSAETRPLTLLASLKSKKLSGIDFTSLSLGEFYFGISPDFDYGSYFLFRNNPAMTNARKWSQFSFFTHNY